MSERAAALARQLQEQGDQLVSLIEGCSEAGWRTVCAAEGWTVGVTAHHLADGHLPAGVQFVELLVNGQPLPPITMEQIDQMNAEHAVAQANCTRPETLAALRRNAARAVEFVGGLSDEQLDRSAPLAAAGGATVSAEQLIQMILIQSSGEHLTSLRAAL